MDWIFTKLEISSDTLTSQNVLYNRVIQLVTKREEKSYTTLCHYFNILLGISSILYHSVTRHITSCSKRYITSITTCYITELYNLLQKDN